MWPFTMLASHAHKTWTDEQLLPLSTLLQGRGLLAALAPVGRSPNVEHKQDEQRRAGKDRKASIDRKSITKCLLWMDGGPTTESSPRSEAKFPPHLSSPPLG